MLDRLYILVEIFVISLCLCHLYGERYSLEYKTIMLFVTDTIIYQGINDHYFPDESSVLIYPILVCYCIWKYKQGMKSAIINTILSVIILSLLQMVSAIIVGLIVPDKAEERVILLLINLLMFIMYVILSQILDLKRLSYYFQKDDVILHIILGGGACCVFVCIYLVRFYKGMYLGQYLVICIITVILYFMAASWERYKIKSLENEIELRTYKIYEESYKNLITEIRLRQHDFKNHINAIYLQHLMCNTYEELVERQKKYCQDIVYENRFTDLLRAGDSMIIGFLFGKLTEADNAGIDVEYKIQCNKLKTDIPMYKIITILGNLINNAIEALESVEKKKLFVSLIENDTALRIEVRNTHEAIAWDHVRQMFKKGYSSKGKNRGLGLYSIKKMSKEYGFEIIFSNKKISGENWVSFEIVIGRKTEDGS